MFAVEATGLTKSFGNNTAVRGIDLTASHGEVVGLLGPNGAGKTTTIMMLLGITTPDSGDISILGHRLPRERSAAMEGTNFWASYAGMPLRLTVRQILRVHADLYGAPPGAVDDVIDRFAIGHLLSRTPTQMSSGQKTLVGLARALVNRPRLLILDEPTAALDPDVAERVRRTLTDIHRDHGTTMLITSHNMADIERLCARVVFIALGRIVADGAPSELSARYGVADLESTFITIAAEARA